MKWAQGIQKSPKYDIILLFYDDIFPIFTFYYLNLTITNRTIQSNRENIQKLKIFQYCSLCINIQKPSSPTLQEDLFNVGKAYLLPRHEIQSITCSKSIPKCCCLH